MDVSSDRITPIYFSYFLIGHFAKISPTTPGMGPWVLKKGRGFALVRSEFLRIALDLFFHFHNLKFDGLLVCLFGTSDTHTHIYSPKW